LECRGCGLRCVSSNSGTRPRSGFHYPRIHSITVLDSAGYHPIRERGHYQVVVGTIWIHHPPRHRNLPSGAYRFKQGGQEAFTFTHSPHFTTPNRCTICTHSASPAHHTPSEPLLDSTFAHVEPDRQPSIYPVRSISGYPDHEHVLKDEPPLGTYCVLLSGRANASMGALHLPVR
jgi:hypothetical protein